MVLLEAGGELKEGKSRIMQILKGAVIAIIVIYAISFLGLILLVNYFPWGGSVLVRDHPLMVTSG